MPRARPPAPARPARLGPGGPGFGANTASSRASPRSSISFNPRFVELLCALRGQEYRPNQLITRFPEEHPTSRPMFQLYDVAWRVRLRPGEAAEVTRLTDPAGPAWFSAGLTRVDSYAALGRDLLALGDAAGARTRPVVSR